MEQVYVGTIKEVNLIKKMVEDVNAYYRDSDQNKRFDVSTSESKEVFVHERV